MRKASPIKKSRGKKPRKPTVKQQKFVEEVLKHGNATKAARDVGYKHPNKQGPANLVKLGIQERIEARIAEAKVQTNEVIGTLASHMRADLADVLPEDEILQKAKEAGVSHLIKKLKVTRRTIPVKDGEPIEQVTHEFEMYSAQEAAKSLCNVLGLNKEAAKNPFDAAKAAYERIVRETGLAPERARQIVAQQFKIRESELISQEVM